MGTLHTVYRLTITTLSPLHIGTGNILRQGYDYVVHNNQTWVIDPGTLAGMLYDQDPDDFERMVRGAPASDLIRPNEYDPASPLFRYVMKGQPRSGKQGAEIQEQIKDPWDRPYIPGSSLKGALRTALAFVGWENRGITLDIRQIGNNPKSAGHQLEEQILYGKESKPYYDLLRAIQVSDSAPDEDSHLQLLNVQVVTRNKTGLPIELEAIPRGVTFTATLTLDGFLRQPEYAEKLGWQSEDQLKWLKKLPQIVNYFTTHRIDQERARWANSHPMLHSFYDTLVRNLRDERTEFLLQLGWGGGWDSKTFAGHLTSDSGVFYQIVKRFERQMDRQKSFKKNDPYPKSRRVVVREQVPTMPLGWIRVRMERVE